MSLRNLTWQQVAVVAVCLGAAFAAHKWLGLDAGMAAGVVTTIVAFLLGRDPPPPPSGGGPNLTLVQGGGALLLAASLLVGCGAWYRGIEDSEDLHDVAAKLAKCRAEGRDAGWDAYEACKRREGL